MKLRFDLNDGDPSALIPALIGKQVYVSDLHPEDAHLDIEIEDGTDSDKETLRKYELRFEEIE